MPEYEIEDPAEEPTKEPSFNIARPLIGFAVSICVAVVSFLTGIVSLCGTPGNGYGGGGDHFTFSTKVLFTILCLSVLSIVVCFIWFLIVLIRKSLND